MRRARQQLKLIISLTLCGVDILCDSLRRLLGLTVRPRCTVLYYHAIPSEQREMFARQLDLIIQLAKPISTDPLTRPEGGHHYVAVTFDDGFVSVLHHAAPELAQRRIPWTIFVPSGCLGRPAAWLRDAGHAARQDRVMTAQELRVLAQTPGVTIGSHGVVHANLLEVSPDQADEELARSKSDLEGIVCRPVDQFSYPFGARNARLDRQAREKGYNGIFCSVPALASEFLDGFVIGRASVDPDTSRLEFRLKVVGAYRWMATIGRLRARLGNGNRSEPAGSLESKRPQAVIGKA